MAGAEATDARLPEFVVSRALPAPRELVWRAWTEAERLAQWWVPPGWTDGRFEVDARVGGTWHIGMRGPDGKVQAIAGTMAEVVPQQRLVLVAAVQDGDGQTSLQTRTTAGFADNGDQTTLTVRVALLTPPAGGATLPDMEAGWEQLLDRLAAHLRPDGETRFTIASDLEVVASRTFAAPRWLVFLALSRAEHLARWWGPIGYTNTVHEMDVRPGGAWRITQHGPDGRDHPFAGTYREVVPAERLTYTWHYAVPPWEDAESVVTYTLAEDAGRTTLVATTRFASQADRDAMIAGGMEGGQRQGWDRLAQDLATTVFGPESPWPGEILATRILDAPRELVWRAWTEPQRLARWWGPHGFRTTTQSMDVTPGGAWRFVMHGPDGRDYPAEMVFAEVSPPARLTYDHTVPPRFRQEVTLVAVGEARTRVTVRSIFPSPEDVQPYAVGGLGQTLERLAADLRTATAGPAEGRGPTVTQL